MQVSNQKYVRPAVRSDAIPTRSEFTGTKQEWEQIAWTKVLDMITGKTKNEIRLLLDSYLSPEEKKRILYRLATAQWLERGMSYRGIGKEIGVSTQTVNAVRKSKAEQRYKSDRERAKTERQHRPKKSLSKNERRLRIVARTKYGVIRK